MNITKCIMQLALRKSVSASRPRSNTWAVIVKQLHLQHSEMCSSLAVVCPQRGSCDSSPYQTCFNTPPSGFQSSTAAPHDNRNPDSHYRRTNTSRSSATRRLTKWIFIVHILGKGKKCIWEVMFVKLKLGLNHSLHVIYSSTLHYAQTVTQTFNTCQTFIAFHSLWAKRDDKKGNLYSESASFGLMWFSSAADTCNLHWAVLLLLWLFFLWLGLTNKPSVTQDFHLVSHRISDYWIQVRVFITLKHQKTSWATYDEVVKLFNPLQLLDVDTKKSLFFFLKRDSMPVEILIWTVVPNKLLEAAGLFHKHRCLPRGFTPASQVLFTSCALTNSRGSHTHVIV